MVKHLLMLNTMRGADSLGILSVNSTLESTKVFKSLGTPWDAMENKGWDRLFQGWHRVLMGHNRAATRGKVSKSNAHPFEFSNVIGAHNGTLTSTFNLNGHGIFEVDSEVIFNHINLHGVEDATSKIQGAFALTWWDRVNNSINFIRNSQRPLHYCTFNNGMTIAWASEAWMLKVASHYEGLDVGVVNEFAVGEHHKYVMESAQTSAIKEKLVSEVKKLNLYTIPIATQMTTTGNGNIFKHKGGGSYTKKFYNGLDVECRIASYTISEYGQHYILARPIEDSSVEIRIYAPKLGGLWNQLMLSSNDFIIGVKSYNGTYYTADLRKITEKVQGGATPLFTGFNNRKFTAPEFLKKLKCNCANCGDMVDLRDAEDLLWINDDSFLCYKCAEDKTVDQYIGNC